MRYLISIGVITVIILSALFGYGADAPAQNSNGEDEKSSTSQMNFCPNCGAELEEGEKFCPMCGYDLINNSLSKGIKKEKYIHEVSPIAGIFGSWNNYASYTDYLFGVDIYFQKSKYDIDNSIHFHPENDYLYLGFSNKVGINVIPRIPKYKLGPLFGVDLKAYLGNGVIFFLGPDIGFYVKFLLGNPTKVTLKPSFYVSPTLLLGSIEGETAAGYVYTYVVFDFDTRFYFSEKIGFLTNFKIKTGSENVSSSYYLEFGPSFLF